MSEQLKSVEKDDNFKNFMQSQKKILESIQKNNADIHYNTKPLALFTLDELFNFLEEHFNEFHEITDFEAVVPFIHRGVEEWSNNRESSCDFGKTLFYLLEAHADDEHKITIVVKVINTILNCLKRMDNNKDLQISRKVFMQFAEILPTTINGKLFSEVASCLKLYMEMYPDNQRDIIKSIWADISQRLISKTSNRVSTEIDIFIHFYDELYAMNTNMFEDPTVIATIQHLLRSEQKDKLRSGYYLCRKMIDYLVEKFNNFGNFLLTSSNCQRIEQLWIMYVKVLENLEAEQLENILTCSSVIEEIVESKQLQTSWLEILYIKLLTHGSLEVVYWSIKFFLKTFTYSDLGADIIEQLLKTSNSMWLYNHEGYCLDPKLFKNFPKGDLTRLYKLIGEIEWKSIPLFIWIKAIYDNEIEVSATKITYTELLKLASRVYNLDSWLMRREITKLFKELFKQIINNMTLKEYVEYVETLYTTTSDFYDDFEIFYGKIPYLKTDDTEYVFSQRFYEILVKTLPKTNVEVNKFLNFLTDIPTKQLGWLKFIPYHYFEIINDENMKIFNKLYGINTDHLKTCKLTDIIANFQNLLTSDDTLQVESIIHCRIAAIAFYIQQKKSFDEEDEETLKIIFNPEISEYNNMMKLPKLWNKLCESLCITKKTLETWIIDEILKRVCDNTVGDKILKYLSTAYNTCTKNKYFKIILDKYPHIFYEHLHNYVYPSILCNQSRFFNSDLEKDEFRIEQQFCLSEFDVYDFKPISYLKTIWISALQKHCNEQYILYLLNSHKELSKKKPIYEENSIEHRIKLRIALAIQWSMPNKFKTFSANIFNEIWNILLHEYNELNICYIYECILATYGANLDTLLEKLKHAQTLTSKQQLSIVSVAYTYFMRNRFSYSEKIETYITYLISLTMLNNSEAGIFAGTALHNFLNTNGFQTTVWQKQILQSIENVMGTKLVENVNDFRLHMHQHQEYQIVRVILFVTKAPFDPWRLFFSSAFCPSSTNLFAQFKYLQTQDQISKCREMFRKRNKDADTAQSLTL